MEIATRIPTIVLTLALMTEGAAFAQVLEDQALQEQLVPQSFKLEAFQGPDSNCSWREIAGVTANLRNDSCSI